MSVSVTAQLILESMRWEGDAERMDDDTRTFERKSKVEGIGT
jgi:hypothetical protein